MAQSYDVQSLSSPSLERVKPTTWQQNTPMLCACTGTGLGFADAFSSVMLASVTLDSRARRVSPSAHKSFTHVAMYDFDTYQAQPCELATACHIDMQQGVAAEGHDKCFQACIHDIITIGHVQAAQGSEPRQQAQACVVGLGLSHVLQAPTAPGTAVLGLLGTGQSVPPAGLLMG